MRGAALADLHLGFRAFQATIDGRNAREVDTEQAWYAAISDIVSQKVDLVTIAGDVFHHPRVSDYAKRAFLRGVQKLLSEGIPTIVLQGNHDSARTSEVLTPIRLADDDLEELLYIVTEPKRVELHIPRLCAGVESQRVSVACFPYTSLKDLPAYKLDPNPNAAINILLMHAAVKGIEGDNHKLPFFYGSSDQALDVGREADRWDVIAVGDYHEFTSLHPKRIAFYSGSLERTSNNIWQEYQRKGWVLYDTATNGYEFQVIPTRDMQDWEIGDFNHPPGVGADEVNSCLTSFALLDKLEGAMVRFKVDAFPKEERQHIDWKLVRQIKRLCLHFYLDIRYAKREVQDLGDRRERGNLTMAEEAAAFFGEDEEGVRNLAFGYLDVTAETEEVAG